MLVTDKVKQGVRWLDNYSKPRPDTTGNLKGDSFFQAGFNGAVDGLYVFGPFGAAFTAGAGALGVGAQKLAPDHKWVGPAVGVLTGAGLAAGLGAVAFGGVSPVVAVATGAMLGGYEVFKGSAEAKVRDSGNGAMLSAPFMPGPARLSGGLAGMLAAHCDTNLGKATVGALSGAALGGGVSLLAAGPSALVPALLAGTVAGAAGPFFGPRYSQFFRNVAADCGKPLKKLADKIHPPAPGDPGVKPKYFQLVGSIPAAFAKEGVKAMVLSHGGVAEAAIGGVKESIRQVHAVMNQQEERKTAAAE